MCYSSVRDNGTPPGSKAGSLRPPHDASTHGTLGVLIGTTRSRVCYFMNKFKKLGYIEYEERLRVHNSSLSGVARFSIKILFCFTHV